MWEYLLVVELCHEVPTKRFQRKLDLYAKAERKYEEFLKRRRAGKQRTAEVLRPTYPEADPEYDYEDSYTLNIFRPGSEESEVIEVNEGYVQILSVMNSLGIEGWELVTESVESRTVGLVNDFDQASYPIRIVSTYKRPLGGPRKVPVDQKEP